MIQRSIIVAAEDEQSEREERKKVGEKGSLSEKNVQTRCQSVSVIARQLELLRMAPFENTFKCDGVRRDGDCHFRLANCGRQKRSTVAGTFFGGGTR